MGVNQRRAAYIAIMILFGIAAVVSWVTSNTTGKVTAFSLTLLAFLSVLLQIPRIQNMSNDVLDTLERVIGRLLGWLGTLRLQAWLRQAVTNPKYLWTIVALLVMAFIIRGFWPTIPPHLTGVAPQACGGAFSDEFQGSLDSRWSKLNLSGSATYSTTQGFLSLSAPPDSDLNPTHHRNFSAPRLLQPISGDFTLSTRISSLSPRANWQGAGILIWQDQATFLRVELAVSEFRPLGINVQQSSRGSFTTVSSPIYYPLTTLPVELSVQKHGALFTVWWRVPGQHWQYVDKTDPRFDSSKLMAGLDLLVVYGAPRTTASYDYFMVSCS